MKHLKIFGKSLPNGVQNIGYSDVFVELMGILIHFLVMSPYASHIKEVIADLAPLLNSTEIDFINNLVNGNTNETTCGYFNGTHENFNTCVAEISFGSAGILIHIIELVVVIVVLKVGKQRDVDKCKLWVRLTAILTGLEALIVVGSLSFNLIHVEGKLISYLIANVIYKLYSCSLIKAYITEARDYKDLPGNNVSDGGSSEQQQQPSTSRGGLSH